MMISVYYVVECQHRHMRADLATLRRLHHDLAIGLLCVNGTFTAGFLAGRPWGDRRHINAMYFHASRLTPHASHLTPRSSPPTSNPSPLTSRPSPPAPHLLPLTARPSPPSTHPSPLAPQPSPPLCVYPLTLPLTPTRCFMISTACFYSMLACIDRMLVSTQERAEDRMPGVAWQAPPPAPPPPSHSPTPTSKIPPPTTITTPHPHPTFTAPPPHPRPYCRAVCGDAQRSLPGVAPLPHRVGPRRGRCHLRRGRAHGVRAARACAWRAPSLTPTHALNASPSLLPLSAHPLRPLLTCLLAY